MSSQSLRSPEASRKKGRAGGRAERRAGFRKGGCRAQAEQKVLPFEAGDL